MPTKPRLSEASVTRTVLDLVRAHGYIPIRTDASTLTRGGHPGQKTGTADWFMAHPERPGFWCELKAQDAKTKPSRAAAQFQFWQKMRGLGFAAYICPDDSPDPILEFRSWFDLLLANGRASAMKRCRKHEGAI